MKKFFIIFSIGLLASCGNNNSTDVEQSTGSISVTEYVAENIHPIATVSENDIEVSDESGVTVYPVGVMSTSEAPTMDGI